MMTPTHRAHAGTPGTREHFLHVATLQRWGTIQDYVELCRRTGISRRTFTPRRSPTWSASTCGAD
jgi:hypothetical protein